MARLNWDKVSREQRAKRHGEFISAFDDLPRTGSTADKNRYLNKKQFKASNKKNGMRETLKKSENRMQLFAECSLCGCMVEKMKEHLQIAHGAEPGLEHPAPPFPSASIAPEFPLATSAISKETEGQLQKYLDQLHEEPDDPEWKGARNLWIKTLPSSARGEIGEKLAAKVLGCTIVVDNKSGYDLVIGEKRIEVKLACAGRMNDYPAIMWRQLRPLDPYTHVCFIAVYPFDVRMFLVPKHEIPKSALLHQHGRGKALDIFCVTTRKVHELMPWMVKHEVFLAERHHPLTDGYLPHIN